MAPPTFGLHVAAVIDPADDADSHSGDATLREQVAVKALELFKAASTEPPSFQQICSAAGMSRTTGYRLFKRGVPSLEEFLAVRSTWYILIRIRTRVASSQTVTFRDAIELGLRGAIDGLGTDDWSQILKRDVNAVTTFLLNRNTGSLLSVLTEYVARCAATFSSSASDPTPAAYQFIWQVFSAFLRDLPHANGVDWPDPDDAKFAALLEGPVSTFLQLVTDDGSTKNSLALPNVTLLVREAS